MKFWEIYRFEMGYQLRRPLTWLYSLPILGLTFMWAAAFLDNARSGELFMYSPLVVAGIGAFSTSFALLLTAALCSDAGLRDVQARMDPLLYTSALSKYSYLGGRLFAVFSLVSGLVMLALPLSLLITRLLPGVEPGLFGQLRPLAFLAAYALFILPSLFVATAILYSLVLLSRYAMASYAGALLLFFCSVFSMDILAGPLNKWEVGKLLDPSGFTILKAFRKSWSPQLLPEQYIPLEESLLLNRLLWMSIALGLLVLAVYKFRFVHWVGGRWRSLLAKPRLRLPSGKGATPVLVPLVARPFGLKTSIHQTLTLAFCSFTALALSWASVIVLAMVGFQIFILPELLEGPLGVPLLATTSNMVGIFSHFIFGIVMALLITLYAGQLIWRERDIRLSDLTDAAPVPDWVQLLGKWLALLLLILSVQAVVMATAMGLQISMGNEELNWGLYLGVFFGFQLMDFVLFALAAFFIHVLINQKYVGHLLVLLFYFYTLLPEKLGLEHNLLVYGADPGWNYSEIRGFSPHLLSWFWFKLFWSGWGLLFLLAAKLVWVRGREEGLNWRLRLAKKASTRSLQLAMGITFLLICAVGSFIFYNTNVLNDYHTAETRAQRRAEYEKRWGQFEETPQPQIAATQLTIELYPHQQKAQVRGSYLLINRSGVAIDSLHIATASEVTTTILDLGRPARPLATGSLAGHSVYILEEPLQAGDSLRLKFEVQYSSQGFLQQGVKAAVTSSSTFFTNKDWLPALGYQPSRELSDEKLRKQYGLPQRPKVPSLYKEAARLNTAGREKIKFEALIGTDQHQTAVAPGTLLRTWTENGRRYFHYATDSPIRNGYAILSAHYAVQEIQWGTVKLQLFHHPRHTLNVERMLRSAKASLAYYSQHFGPFPHRQLTLAEYAGKGSLTSFEGLITYAEDFAELNPDKDWRNFDLPFAVIAHEVAHQWWGNQLIPAHVEGAPLLSESLAWYSALGVIEETYGAQHLQRILEVMHEAYLSPRSRADKPLIRATDQFQGYRKGPFAMFALREYIGEKGVNLALRQLFRQHGQGKPPLPVSLDLYQELETITPDSLSYLLSDLFETNTFWDLSTQQVVAEPTANGTWRVHLDVVAHKHQVDTAGTETEAPMDDLVEIGIYPPDADGVAEKPLYLQKHRLRSGKQRITVEVAQQPKLAGIDPRYLLMDTNMQDNLKEIEEKSAPKPAPAKASLAP